MASGKLDFSHAMDLATTYLRLGMEAQFQGRTRSLIDTPTLQSDDGPGVFRLHL